MSRPIGHLAVIGQGLIGSSITRAVYERKLAREVTITDFDPKVRKRLLELGLGQAKVVETNAEAVRNADLVIICVPVGVFPSVAKSVLPFMKPGAILSDVGSVKSDLVDAVLPDLPPSIHFIPAHPLAGTEFSGPDAGLPKLFVNRWCIVTPPKTHDPGALETVCRFWSDLGSQVEIMDAKRHDYALAITSHLPHLVAFSIFHTALAQEVKTGTPVIQFSAGAFRDFTRIASSNPVMWRDIFLKNKEPILAMFKNLIADMQSVAKAIENDDAQTLEAMLSKSRTTRRKVIDEDHISLRPEKQPDERADTIIRPYATDE
jgi:cyclohexadieny/prephenate dehydrogenase